MVTNPDAERNFSKGSNLVVVEIVPCGILVGDDVQRLALCSAAALSAAAFMSSSKS